MSDNNSYTSKQNIKRYTTQAKFDAIDKSDVPVGTNIISSERLKKQICQARYKQK